MIRVFPRRTKWTPNDDFAFVGDPPIVGRPPEQPVYISCAFTWDIFEAERLFNAWSVFYKDVYIGGPAFNDHGMQFEPGIFIKTGVTITSRGCPKTCPWCFVNPREGVIRELEIKPGYIVQDNNLLACSIEHVRMVFNMLRNQNRAIYFNGGLDADFITEEHADLLRSIKIGELWFACDYPGAEAGLERVKNLLPEIKRRKMKCYTMVGYNGETFKSAERRIKEVWDLGFEPFAALYQPSSIKQKQYNKRWRNLVKTWSRPAAMKSHLNPKKSKQMELFKPNT